MSNKISEKMLSAIVAVLMMSASSYSQNINFSPPQTMGATINSTSNETNAVISPNGLSLYFTSNRTGGQGQSDIWVSHRNSLSSAWGTPQNLGATVNTSATESIGSFSLDGKTMFLQSDRTGAGGQGLRDNYISTRTDPNNDFGWTTPVNLGPVVNSSSEDFAAVYFEDPVTGAGSIIFSSNRIGDPTIDFHLYQSTRNANGTFNAPTQLSELNIGAEIKVAIRRDGLQLFMMATLPPPETFDIWVSTRVSTTSSWNLPTRVPGISSQTVEDGSPSLSPDGLILYFHSASSGGSGGNDLYSVALCSVYTTAPCANRTPAADFDGDGRSDISIFRPSDSTWWVMQTGTNTVTARQFGASGDKIVPGDYDGDGRTDMAVFRPSDPSWWILRSSDNTFSVTQFGLANDKPVPADYDGDGKTDIAVYRNGTWYIKQSSQNGSITYQFFGLTDDIPVAGVSAQ